MYRPGVLSEHTQRHCERSEAIQEALKTLWLRRQKELRNDSIERQQTVSGGAWQSTRRQNEEKPMLPKRKDKK